MKESPIEIERHNALRKQRLEEIDKLHRNSSLTKFPNSIWKIVNLRN